MRNIVHVGAAREQAKNKEFNYFYFEPREDDGWIIDTEQDNVTVFPFALSNYNGTAQLNVTKKPTVSSFYEPNMELIKKCQPKNGDRYNVINNIDVEVKRMDSIFDNDFQIHKLVLDTQGSELNILKGAGDLLNNVETIECEVEFVEVYKNQPLYEDVNKYLKKYGFKLSHFRTLIKWSGYLIFADAIYKR